MLTLTKIFRFEAAHAIHGYAGKCRHIHGHTYTLHVTVSGVLKDEKGHPFDGMIMDFTDLKKWVNEAVIRHFDHFLLLRKESALSKMSFPEWDRIYLTDYQPSCENMLLDMAQRLMDSLPEGIKIRRLKLYETPTAYADLEF